MAVAEKAERDHGGRQAAYTARNRAALILAAQEVLADIGLDATIEQLAAHAQVSPRTIYNYFETKDALLSLAFEQIWQEGLDWAYDGRPRGESLQIMLDVARKLFRISVARPLLAKVLKNTMTNPSFAIASAWNESFTAFDLVAKAEGLDSPEIEKRVYLFAHCYTGILQGIFVTGQVSPEEADVLLGMSLTILNLPREQAEKMTSAPLVLPAG